MSALMRFRRNASIVQAVRLDGSEASWRAVLAIKGGTVARRPDGVEIATDFGRRIVRLGQVLTLDDATGALRVHDGAHFDADHEPLC